MQAYEIAAATGGQVLTLGTTDRASDALQKLRLALEQYGRAWVTDSSGADISMSELTARSIAEQPRL